MRWKRKAGFPVTAKGLAGRAFLEDQIVKAGQKLGNIWLTAWLDAPEDTYLQKQLQQRAAAESQTTELIRAHDRSHPHAHRRDPGFWPWRSGPSARTD